MNERGFQKYVSTDVLQYGNRPDAGDSRGVRVTNTMGIARHFDVCRCAEDSEVYHTEPN